ncbi:uncharacterized protein LOC6725221 [Drosophila simulans]|uniref:GD16760 n=1 Tax=Drosophila simulans TaxID=7240 RepID=B4R597_DROSI|nr:uncharacterized protein LOC6725221 [Drosophila simulans]EDX17193.1 GD16760 [Drosophila simulans]
MTNLKCVFLAGLLHVIKFLAFDSKSPNAPAPKLPSLIVGLAAMDLIWDINLVPRLLQNSPAVIRRLYDVIVSYLLLGLFMGFWKSVDNICVILLRILIIGTGHVSESNYENYESHWVGTVTVPLSLLILAFAGEATGHFPVLRREEVMIQLLWKGYLRYIS